MELFEKVEKLRQRANVSYEEAKAALDATNGDLLDAMIYLEKQGKTEAPTKESYSTKNDEAGKTVTSSARTEDKSGKKKFDKEKAKKNVESILEKSDKNHFLVTRSGKKFIEIPIWALVLICLFAWGFTIVFLIVGLFCDCSYSFVGPDDLNAANKVCDAVKNASDDIHDSFVNKDKENQQ